MKRSCRTPSKFSAENICILRNVLPTRTNSSRFHSDSQSLPTRARPCLVVTSVFGLVLDHMELTYHDVRILLLTEFSKMFLYFYNMFQLSSLGLGNIVPGSVQGKSLNQVC